MTSRSIPGTTSARPVIRVAGPEPSASLPLMQLIADAMLGRLARWLRALGHDVIYDEALDDPELAGLARDQHRLLLTRDRRLCEERDSPAWCVLLTGNSPGAQLREVDQRLDIFTTGWRSRLFTRCIGCNAPLAPVSYREIRAELPPEVRPDPRVRSAGFMRCPSCDGIYWEGSHTRRMRRWLEARVSETKGRR